MFGKNKGLPSPQIMLRFGKASYPNYTQNNGKYYYQGVEYNPPGPKNKASLYRYGISGGYYIGDINTRVYSPFQLSLLEGYKVNYLRYVAPNYSFIDLSYFIFDRNTPKGTFLQVVFNSPKVQLLDIYKGTLGSILSHEITYAGGGGGSQGIITIFKDDNGSINIRGFNAFVGSTTVTNIGIAVSPFIVARDGGAGPSPLAIESIATNYRRR